MHERFNSRQLKQHVFLVVYNEVEGCGYMDSNEKLQNNLKNVNFVEDIDDNELQDLVLEAQREALSKEAQEKTNRRN